MKKLLLIVTCVQFTLFGLAIPATGIAADILINDFEAADYGGWILGNPPAPPVRTVKALPFPA